MYPSRPAPLPPSNAKCPERPFPVFYAPRHANVSYASLPSVSSSSCPSSPSSSRRAPTPASYLAAPLSPRPTMHTSYPNSLTANKSPIPLPADLSLFDHQPRQNLLGDLEIILGRRLTFPFIEKFNKEKKENKREKNPQRAARTLKKPRDHSWEEDFAYEAVGLLTPQKGRGVREGNWI
ncbi:hypothetical protein DB88DRAFT_486409 [Papiliotrema laurentii]|uniref:Uncharacterized protein n=1 Tax=Papiliotrema laurentii TaxID=5418 RepID=A0AAD9FR64_PAPLA|nr:hypothetical protein DB88DRAFT_486409 [Papiliotrema laurentii]